MSNTLKAPFPYYGGKVRVADVVWERFGDVPNYVEPFFGSGAMLLKRPHEPGTETVNDIDALLANFWRALQHAPDEVAYWADWPVNEVDLHARHRYLVDRRGWVEELMSDPDRYDVKLAGWWVWGISQWIGSGWCPPARIANVGGLTRKPPHVGDAGRGIHRASDAHALWQARPDLSSSGRGDAAPRLARKRPVIAVRVGGATVFRRAADNTPRLSQQLPELRGDSGAFDQKTGGLYTYFEALAERLRRVRVCCGDWRRVLGPSVTWRHGLTAIFLDPPYAQEGRSDVYAYESRIFNEVRAWALENGNNPLLRIALCGYNFEMPSDWQCYRWKAPGGYGSQGEGLGRANAHKECIWFSPHCLKPKEEAFKRFAQPIKVKHTTDYGPLFELAPTPPATLIARLAAFGWSLHYDPIEHHGYRAEWRLDGCGEPSWFGALTGVEDWLRHQEHAEVRKEAA